MEEIKITGEMYHIDFRLGDIDVTIYESGNIIFSFDEERGNISLSTEDIVEIGRRSNLFRDRRIAYLEKEKLDAVVYRKAFKI